MKYRIVALICALSMIMSLVTPAMATETVHDEVTDVSISEVVEEEVGKELKTAGETTIVAAGECGDNLTWSLDSEGTLTISGTGDMYDYDATSNLPPWKSYLSSENFLIIEEGVKSIGNYAFYRCESIVNDLVIPESVVKVGEYSFYWNRANGNSRTLTLSKNIAEIGKSAFSECYFAGELKLPESLEGIGENAFCGNNFKGDLIIPDNIAEIPEGAFDGAGFEGNLVLSNDLTEIGIRSFEDCNFTGELVLPESLTTILGNAFYGCDFDVITFLNMNCQIGDEHWQSTDSYMKEILPSGATIKAALYSTAQEYAKKYGRKFVELIKEETGDCGKNAIWKLEVDGTLTISGIGEITVDDSEYPFYNFNHRINKVIIEEGITGIGLRALTDLNIKSISLPKTLKTIGEAAFAGTTIQSVLVIPDSVESISGDQSGFGGAFGGTTLDGIVLPNTLTKITKQMFIASCIKTKLVIPDSVLSIDESAFLYANLVEGISLPNSLKEIGSSAFEQCDTYYYPIVLPDSVEKIDSSAFRNCRQISSKLPDNLVSIGSYAFDNSGISGELIIPEGTTYVGSSAFSNSAITSISLPESLNKLEDSVFENCRELKGIVSIPETISTIENEAFAGATGIAEIIINNSKCNIYQNALVFESSVILGGDIGSTIEAYAEKFDRVFKAYCVHVWNEDYTVDKEPSCTEEGEKSIYCSKCKIVDVATTEIIPALGHNWDDGTIMTEPLCETSGSEVFVCQRCSEEKIENTDALGHDWKKEYTIDKKATCTEDGEKSIHCDRCDVVKEGSKVDIRKFGHDWNEGTVTIEPSCDELGSKLFICQRCYEEKSEDIEALGHIWNNEYTVDKEPTCTEEGEKSIHCTRCDDVKKDTSVTIAVLGHDWNEGIILKEATCNYEGERTFKCLRCTEEYNEFIPKKEHSLGEWTVHIGATYSKEGTSIRCCQTCNFYFETKPIDKLIPEKVDILYQPEKVLLLGESMTLSGDAEPHPAKQEDKTWSSSNEAVATVDSYGKVTAISVGNAQITLEIGGLSSTCEVYVRDGVKKGRCFISTSCYWVLEADGTLRIVGEGEACPRINEFDDFKNDVKRIVIEEGITKIGDYAFYYFKETTGELVLPNSLREIGEGAFVGGGFSGELKLPSNLKIIGDHAFSVCKNLSGDLIISDSVESIGESAFSTCSGLNGELVLSSSLTRIEPRTFEATGLTGEIVIPENINFIGWSAFLSDGLSKVTVLNKNCEFNVTSTSMIFPEKLMLVGYKGSTAEEYAINTNRTFMDISTGEILYPEDNEPEPTLPEPTPPVQIPFTDVRSTDWFLESAGYVYSHGLMTGMTPTTFGPAINLSRAQFAVILWRMNGSPAMSYRATFPDVPAGTWYTDAVLWANEQGIITGYSHNGHFGSADNITREQMALMMYRYANSKSYDTSAKAEFDRFKDANKVSPFAVEGMQWAVGKSIITGKENGTAIDPQGNASRAECATIIMRFMKAYEE